MFCTSYERKSQHQQMNKQQRTVQIKTISNEKNCSRWCKMETNNSELRKHDSGWWMMANALIHSFNFSRSLSLSSPPILCHYVIRCAYVYFRCLIITSNYMHLHSLQMLAACMCEFCTVKCILMTGSRARTSRKPTKIQSFCAFPFHNGAMLFFVSAFANAGKKCYINWIKRDCA